MLPYGFSPEVRAELERLVDDRSVRVRLAMATSEVVPPHTSRPSVLIRRRGGQCGP
ncbi:hypothetical protein AB0B63_30450 [Micromonospora sp. NPDC049081]|uniref:hypothetical protein n=1 Tax=Micromonospora sp. NPDC049081 TaxID=3155150 RepID=UPI0033E9A790